MQSSLHVPLPLIAATERCVDRESLGMRLGKIAASVRHSQSSFRVFTRVAARSVAQTQLSS